MAEALQIENGLGPYTVKQPFGEVADMILLEIPHHQNPGRDAGLDMGVAAITEILPQVLTVPESLHKLCQGHRRVSVALS